MDHKTEGFEARYDSTCSICKEPIEVGDEIESRGGTRYAHVICPRTAEVTCSICGDKWVECDCP